LLPASPLAAEDAASAEPTPTAAEATSEEPDVASPVAKKTIVVLDLEAIDVDPDKLRIVNGAVVDQLATYDQIEVISQADIKQMVDFEAEKASVGCDTNSCLSEIAGAMGAAYVVFGQAGRLDDVIFVQLNLFDSAKARAVGREDVRSKKLSELPDLVVPAVGRLVQPLTGEAPPPEPTFAEESSGGGGLGPVLLWSGVAAMGVGVLGAIGAGLATIPFDETLGQSTATTSEKNTARTVGLSLVVGAGVGGVVALAGAGLAGASFIVE
jgi:TolB-like protein